MKEKKMKEEFDNLKASLDDAEFELQQKHTIIKQ